MIWDPHLSDGKRVEVLDHGSLDGERKRYSGMSGQIMRAYIASCRVRLDNGQEVSLPKSALRLLESKRK